jgi:hypothetical protein
MHAADPDRIWDPKIGKAAPVAPYDRDLSKAVPKIFDRNSIPPRSVAADWLRSVGNVLRGYHLQPEYKFLGGGWTESGILRRRHVLADGIEDIGKESDGWDEDDARADGEEPFVSYGSSDNDRDRMIEAIKLAPVRRLAREAGIAVRTIEAVRKDSESVSDADLRRMAEAAHRIDAQKAKSMAEQTAAVNWLAREHAKKGLASLALDLAEDKANLLKVISRKRKPSKALVLKVQRVNHLG